MKIKYIISMFLVCLMLFVTACDETTTTDDQSALKQSGTSEKFFLGGTEGVMAKFEPFGIEKAGSYEILAKDTFPVEIVIKNRGEEDILANGLRVKLSGIKKSDFEGWESTDDGVLKNDEKIEKKSNFNVDGGEERISFGNMIEYGPDLTGTFKPDIFAIIDYDYKTKLIIPSVCLKGDVRSEEICDVESTLAYDVSGAPITITNVEQKPSGKGKVAVIIDVSNAGGGKATIQGQDKDFDNRYDVVKFNVLTNSDEWTCRGTGGRENELRLEDGKGQIICRTINALEEEQAYTQQMELDLDYKYQTIIKQSLTILSDFEE